MKHEDVPITQGQNTRKEVKNREAKQKFETDCEITLSWESNSEQSLQEVCGDGEIG